MAALANIVGLWHIFVIMKIQFTVFEKCYVLIFVVSEIKFIDKDI